MTLETAMKAVHFVIKNAEEYNVHITNEKSKVIPSINFFGGEPLLMWDDIIKPLALYIRNEYTKPFSLGMTSNCTLLSEERIRFMKEHNISLLFSIDGAKETQDYNRPSHCSKSSFDMLKDKIPLIAENFKTTTFRSTIIPDTVHHTFGNFKFGIESGFVNVFQIPNVFEYWNDNALQMLEQELHKIGAYYIDSYLKGKPVNYSPLDQKMNDIQFINRAIDKKNPKNFFKCGFGVKGSCAVDCKGNLIGCQEMTSYIDQRFLVGNLDDGLDTKKASDFINTFAQQEIKGKNCDECGLEPICNGGCVANNFIYSNSLNTVPDVFCIWEQLLLKEAVHIMNVLGEAKCEAFKNKFFRG